MTFLRRCGGLALLLVALLILVQCGARSALRAGGGPAPGAGGVGGAADGGGGMGFGGIIEEPQCTLVPVGSPVEVMSFPDRQLQAPSMVAIEQPSDKTTPRLALQAFAGGGASTLHPDIQLMALGLGGPWPAVTIEHGPELFGIESHGWAELARSSDADHVGMAWYSDPGQVGRTAFRRLRIDNWQAEPPVDVSFDGESAVALAAGASVGDLGVGHGGHGYGIAWRENVGDVSDPDVRVMIAVLDLDGEIVLGPHPQGITADYPGFSPSMVWTGEAYLLATAFGDCTAEGCPGELAVHRIRPASGDLVDDSGIDLVWAEDRPARPGRPTIAHHDGRTWMSWTEGNPNDPIGRRSLWIQELDPRGERIGEARRVTDAARPVTRLTMHAGPFGVAVVHAEDGDITLPDTEPGRSHIVVEQLDETGARVRSPIPLHATRVDTYGPPDSAALGNNLLVTWAGRSMKTGLSVIYLALLECINEPCSSAEDCDENEWCEARCCSELGKCVVRPEGCFDDCPEITACGGGLFCNECDAHYSGVDTAEASCPSATFFARALDTDRIVVTKAEPLDDLCFRLVLAPGPGGYPGITVTEGWGVAFVDVRQGAIDCHETDVEGIPASVGTELGTVTLDASACTLVSVDATASFPGGPSWLPEMVAFSVQNQPVEGCP